MTSYVTVKLYVDMTRLYDSLLFETRPAFAKIIISCWNVNQMNSTIFSFLYTIKVKDAKTLNNLE